MILEGDLETFSNVVCKIKLLFFTILHVFIIKYGAIDHTEKAFVDFCETGDCLGSPDYCCFQLNYIS